MESGSKKKEKVSEECVGAGRDRLSELPDQVLVNILSFLPTLDAVRTVLLRRFGNLWTLVPALDFSDEYIPWEWNGTSESESESESSGFSLFVRHVLILHKMPTIEKFRLSISYYARVPDAEVLLCLRFALSREAKTLIVDLDWLESPHLPIPCSLFTSQFLVTLTLEYCEIKATSRACLGSLKILSLISVRMHDSDSLNGFLSGCPSLQELVLENSDDLTISSPSIVKLDIDDEDIYSMWTIDCTNLKSLDICMLPLVNYLNVPSVRQVTIRSPLSVFDSEELDQTTALQFKRFLEGVQNAEVFTFEGDDPSELLTRYFKVNNIDVSRNRWKRVVLNSTIQEPYIAGICDLVRSLPCLEELVIHVTRYGAVCHEVPSPCVASHLKLVSMHGYAKPYDGQLHLAEFLLKSAVNLDRLVIFSNHRRKLSSSKELRFVKQLSNCPRASTKARVVFK